MKIGVIIARVLLGFIFVFFGANGLHPFLPMPPTPPGLVGQFMTVFMQSHWVMVIATVQVIGGLLLLVGRYVPLALALLGPVIVNILTFHLLMNLAGIGPGVVVTILWLFLFYRYRANFAGLFVAKAE
jgi:putative oxidoreductase